jgi:hypothetical protein
MGETFNIPIPEDESGYIGRECPKCNKYFKIAPDTLLDSDDRTCHCPHCGHLGSLDEFCTEEQLEYAKSIVFRKVTDAVHKDLEDMARDLNRKTRNSLVPIKMEVHGRPDPIRYYQEKRLETEVVCGNCSLRYAIYGVFAFCPACGSHNSIQILEKNLELACKILSVAEQESDLSEKFVENALLNSISSFDAFGREICQRYAAYVVATIPKNLSFQSPQGASKNLKRCFRIGMSACLEPSEWEFVNRCAQKRHLIEHRMGVVDDEYLNKTNDPDAIKGRKIEVLPDEVRTLVRHLRTLALHIAEELQKLSKKGETEDQAGAGGNQ